MVVNFNCHLLYCASNRKKSKLAKFTRKWHEWMCTPSTRLILCSGRVKGKDLLDPDIVKKFVTYTSWYGCSSYLPVDFFLHLVRKRSKGICFWFTTFCFWNQIGQCRQHQVYCNIKCVDNTQSNHDYCIDEKVLDIYAGMTCKVEPKLKCLLAIVQVFANCTIKINATTWLIG